MNPADYTGISFVLGILGMGATFIVVYFKNNSSLCERITKLESVVDNLSNMIESLRQDRDRFHPRN